ncbi:uncharacterized protein BO97DRAFT_403721 [Aspergillus homomorphus CBS 101889]|uniref:Uncharacterized protein n=1 Tax=Aspergillus homomorphus (strain CBS 101889) TaxID=1450537 RepID=A0A395I5L8_ASPHC|nr:hypothetical protein BO97DRAFT_403721 [Aspergillus homomorphus CBS 101889]RAL15085.1 hypothetical protein BO97DRAFT_403721 [Aspergillus homomorphus CBS 101889]
MSTTSPPLLRNMNMSISSGPGPEQAYFSPGVNTTSSKIYPTLEVTEISLPPPPCMDVLDRSPRRKRTPSPSSPATTTATTSSSSSSSSSSSTSRHHRKTSLQSRHSSLHSHRRTATSATTTVSITPIADQPTRREDLLALHRESCRLFQQQQQPLSPTTSPSTPRNQRSPSTSSNLTTNPQRNSPISIRDVHKTPVRASTLPVWDRPDDHPSKTTVTVIDWTSPSTRRREYEKIDKASSGVRGFWRRVAPKWCQSRARRMPFFEEKDGKGNYEGSVRRFRMDLPE